MAHLDAFQYLILAALETWMPPGGIYFVVLSTSWEADYNKFCQDLPEAFLNSTITNFCDRIHPIFVDCPDAHWGFSPCCKQEKGLQEVFQDHGESYDWFVYSDDDNYFRLPILNGILTQLDPTVPQIATSGGMLSDTNPLGKSGYMKKKSPYDCSSDENKMYPWGQPVVYSRAALARIQRGLQLEGLTKECVAFDVTHDTGNAIFHYMHSLPEVRFGMAQRIGFNFDMKRWAPEELAGLHGTMMTEERKFRKMVTMVQVHDGWKSQNASVPKLVFHRPTGFTNTSIYKEFGDVESWNEWHTFETKDCN
jgi:hypothetical protein